MSLAYDIHDEAGSKGEPLVVGDWFVVSVSHLNFVMSVSFAPELFLKILQLLCSLAHV